MERYGLIGFPLHHSFSRKYFTEKFDQLKADCIYENFELEDISRIREIVNEYDDLFGLNVTIPHKETVISHLDELSTRASAIGAVNTIKIIREANREPILSGHNTDVLAFKHCVLQLNIPGNFRALVLGTGGASKAVRHALKELGISCTTVSRTATGETISYEMVDAVTIKNHLLIVNCTPLGTFPNTDTLPDIPYNALFSRHFLFDLVYNPEVTSFMKQGIEYGATVKNGYDMLVYQAERSWDIWTSEDMF